LPLLKFQPSYEDLITEIQLMWNVKARVTPVKAGATGTFLKITQTVPEQHKGKTRN